MKFYLINNTTSVPSKAKFPYATLHWNNWDDYGYQTSFEVIVHLTSDEIIELGRVKILRREQDGGKTPLREKSFETLDSSYCSLGHGLDYYENIVKFGDKLSREYLVGVRDVAFDDTIRAEFEDLEGYKVSLLRFSGAERLIENAARLFASSGKPHFQKRRGFSLKFKTTFTPDGRPVIAEFNFNRRGKLPNRINALIGYNGTGKTKLLSNLAIVASEYGYDTKEDFIRKVAGRFIDTKPPIVRVIVVSYSAFDMFVIPDEEEAERVGYVYCGLRMNVHDIHGRERDLVYTLKSPAAVERDFINACTRISHQDRNGEFSAALVPLLNDSSFRRIGVSGLLDWRDDDEVIELFRSLSSGHKIVLKIVVELTAFMDGKEPTLVLIDEPETHLHPPLVATLLRSVRECLDQLNGFAIVATHSPVVLQELPSQYVRVLRRVSNRAKFQRPDIETFGESIGRITEHVFNLDDSTTDWHQTLTDLAKDMSLEEINDLFERRLGFAARSFVASTCASDEV